jgi:ABC-2 type transport system ATP-binding protein
LPEEGEQMTASEDVVLDVEGLRMRYCTIDVLHGVTSRVRGGEVVALLCPNGEGKTTTIEILKGFRMRSAGQAEVLGLGGPSRTAVPRRAHRWLRPAGPA